jgi:hypothetical protein
MKPCELLLSLAHRDNRLIQFRLWGDLKEDDAGQYPQTATGPFPQG